MQTAVKISVVIPCYNGGIYLKDAIESVLNQTEKDFELIYVDDQSKDGSYEVAAQYATKDPRVKVFKNPQNLGMVGNWNRAMELASGRYIKVLCADDVIHPHCLQEQAALLDQNAEVVLVTSPSSVINSKGHHVLYRDPFGSRQSRRPISYTFEELFSKCVEKAANIVGEPSITLIRASTIKEAGWFSEEFRYGTDLEYWFRLLAVGGKIASTTGVEAGFRLHPGSLTNTQMTRGKNELGKIFQKYAQMNKPLPFDLASFCNQYARQTLLKGMVIKSCESFLGRVLLNSADRIRSAFQA